VSVHKWLFIEPSTSRSVIIRYQFSHQRLEQAGFFRNVYQYRL